MNFGMGDLLEATGQSAAPTLALVGMPAAGKTTIGRRLASALGRTAVDLDPRIEQEIGCSIRQYFAYQGEARFRKVEARVLRDVLAERPGVLSTGGGTVLLEGNRQLLREKARVIFLQASPEQLLPRLRGDGSRPLLQVTDTLQRLLQLQAQREGLYRKTAHVVVPVGPGGPRAVVSRILVATGLGRPRAAGSAFHAQKEASHAIS